MKYRLKGPANGSGAAEPIDKTIEDTWRRVAKAIAAPEKDPEAWAERFYNAMCDFRFLPAGRVIAGAGAGRPGDPVQLLLCHGHHSRRHERHLRKYARGGADDAAGRRHRLRLLHPAAARRLREGGRRRRLGPALLHGCVGRDVPHDYVGRLSPRRDDGDPSLRPPRYRKPLSRAKREPGRLRMFNLSVLVTDAFMQAIEEEAPWQLQFGGTVHHTLPARELCDKILRATYAFAEPGVIFHRTASTARTTCGIAKRSAKPNPCLTAETWIFTSEGPRADRRAC